jgi:hypothetical protein
MHLLSMSTRSFLMVGSATLIACGALAVACSNGGFNNDGGVDSGGGDATNDNNVGPDTKPPGDGGGQDVVTGPCTTTPIKGDCDIVAQDCPTGKECVVTQLSDGGFATACAPNGQGSIPEGYACTPNANNPCVPGLECIQHRCSKHCCLGNDSECGASHPEGYAGRCDLNITVDGVNTAYSVCTYSSACQPFGIQSCTSDSTCLIQDNSGTAKCTGYPGPDGGLPENAKCQFANDCADGMMCLNKGDAGSCTWVCYVPPGPYDAGIAQLGQGKGGCKAPETCASVNWGGQLPVWLGVCQ